MITPKYTLSQDDNFVYISLHCPYIKAQEVEFYIEGTEFKFYVKPYYLRLIFPGQIIENGQEHASYDIGTGQVSVKIPKLTTGEFFKDLDLIGAFSSMRYKKQDEEFLGRPVIEVVGGESNLQDDGMDSGPKQYEQKVSVNEMESSPQLATPTASSAYYGFNNLYHSQEQTIFELCLEVLDITSLDHSTTESRRAERMERENEKFDEDYYMYQFVNDDEIREVLAYTAPWQVAREKWKNWVRKVEDSTEDGDVIVVKKEEEEEEEEADKGVIEQQTQSTPLRTVSSALLDLERVPTENPLFTIPTKDSNSDDYENITESKPPLVQLISDAYPTPAPSPQPSISEVQTATLIDKLKNISIEDEESGVETESCSDSDDETESSSSEEETDSDSDSEEDTPTQKPTLVFNVNEDDILFSTNSKDTVIDDFAGYTLDMSLVDEDSFLKLNEKDLATLGSIPRREYLIDSTKPLYFLLLDLLTAYTFELRATQNEPNVESSWTISKLSASLSAFENDYDSIPHFVTTFVRRSLCYPLFRHFGLAKHVLSEDVASILRLGYRGVLKALVEIHHLLEKDERCYALNRIFVNDLICWVMRSVEANEMERRGVTVEMAKESRFSEDVCRKLAVVLEWVCGDKSNVETKELEWVKQWPKVSKDWTEWDLDVLESVAEEIKDDMMEQ